MTLQALKGIRSTYALNAIILREARRVLAEERWAAHVAAGPQPDCFSFPKPRQETA